MAHFLCAPERLSWVSSLRAWSYCLCCHFCSAPGGWSHHGPESVWRVGFPPNLRTLASATPRNSQKQFPSLQLPFAPAQRRLLVSLFLRPCSEILSLRKSRCCCLHPAVPMPPPVMLLSLGLTAPACPVTGKVCCSLNGGTTSPAAAAAWWSSPFWHCRTLCTGECQLVHTRDLLRSHTRSCYRSVVLYGCAMFDVSPSGRLSPTAPLPTPGGMGFRDSLQPLG